MMRKVLSPQARQFASEMRAQSTKREMTAWQEWVRLPQNLWIRKALFQVHLWAGLGIGLFTWWPSASPAAQFPRLPARAGQEVLAQQSGCVPVGPTDERRGIDTARTASLPGIRSGLRTRGADGGRCRTTLVLVNAPYTKNRTAIRPRSGAGADILGNPHSMSLARSRLAG